MKERESEREGNKAIELNRSANNKTIIKYGKDRVLLLAYLRQFNYVRVVVGIFSLSLCCYFQIINCFCLLVLLLQSNDGRGFASICEVFRRTLHRFENESKNHSYFMKRKTKYV